MKRAARDEFQVAPEMWVRLFARVWDADGEEIEPGTELGFVFGYHPLLPALESALEGLTAGARHALSVPPEQAFGKRDPKAVLEVSREEFPDGVQPGDIFEADEEDAEASEPVVLRVLEVTDDAVILDRNHPLAGQSLRFELEVLEVRPATDSELAQAQAALADPKPAEAPLIPVARLLLGGSQRYEKGPSRA